MSVPLPPLEQLGHRPFSFYPPIGNIAHNEWLYRKANWSEVLVQNTKTMEEIWVPRFYLGAVSSVDEPVMLVGLTKELEYKAGALWPVQRRVIEMPRAVNETRRYRIIESAPSGPAAVVGIRVESHPGSRFSRVVFGGVALAIVGCVLVVSVFRGGVLANRLLFTPAWHNELGLSSTDSREDVVRLLGRPAAEHTSSQPGLRQFQILEYRRQGFFIVLMGQDHDPARYIGALDRNWRPIHAVKMPGGGNSETLLRSLRRP